MERKEVILSLDTASKKTGYAIYRAGKIIKSGTWTFKRPTRYRDLLFNLQDTIDGYGVTQIVSEDVYRDNDSKKGKYYKVLCECRGIVECVAQITDVPIAFIAAIYVEQQLRIFPAGSCQYGRSEAQKAARREEKKKRMIRLVTRLRYDLETPDADDEADAIGLLITYLKDRKLPLKFPGE